MCRQRTDHALILVAPDEAQFALCRSLVGEAKSACGMRRARKPAFDPARLHRFAEISGGLRALGHDAGDLGADSGEGGGWMRDFISNFADYASFSELALGGVRPEGREIVCGASAIRRLTAASRCRSRPMRRTAGAIWPAPAREADSGSEKRAVPLVGCGEPGEPAAHSNSATGSAIRIPFCCSSRRRRWKRAPIKKYAGRRRRLRPHLPAGRAGAVPCMGESCGASV